MSCRSQPPQPKYFVQLPVSAYLPGRPCGRPVVLAQELVMKPCGQHTQDLDWVIGIKLMYWLSAHTPAGYQREASRPPKARGQNPAASAIAATGRRAVAALLVAGNPDVRPNR
jgi:hypothetical protein